MGTKETRNLVGLLAKRRITLKRGKAASERASGRKRVDREPRDESPSPLNVYIPRKRGQNVQANIAAVLEGYVKFFDPMGNFSDTRVSIDRS